MSLKGIKGKINEIEGLVAKVGMEGGREPMVIEEGMVRGKRHKGWKNVPPQHGNLFSLGIQKRTACQ